MRNRWNSYCRNVKYTNDLSFQEAVSSLREWIDCVLEWLKWHFLLFIRPRFIILVHLLLCFLFLMSPDINACFKSKILICTGGAAKHDGLDFFDISLRYLITLRVETDISSRSFNAQGMSLRWLNRKEKRLHQSFVSWIPAMWLHEALEEPVRCIDQAHRGFLVQKTFCFRCLVDLVMST